jgi:hypothetical protein
MRRALLIFCLILPIVAVSCYYDYGMSVEDFDVVVTRYDSTADFGAISTYAMPDSVVHLIGDGEVREVNRLFDSLILQTVSDNMAARGYTREMDPENNAPDAIVLVSVTSSNIYAVASYYPYWDYWGWYPGWGYYPGYGPGWGISYPWYPYPTAVYSYSTGSVLIDMVDADSQDDAEQLVSSIWLGGMNGVLNDTQESLEARIESGIDQCFSQSPYLQAQ